MKYSVVFLPVIAFISAFFGGVMTRSISRLFLMVALVLPSGSLLAETFQCDFDQWKGGASEEITMSWVGMGFVADSKRSTISIKVDGGFSDPVAVKVTKQDRFTDFSFTQNDKTTRGDTLTMRYIFRVFINGKCEGRVTEAGYVGSFLASGRVSVE